MIVLERYPLHPRFDPLELINSQQLSEFQTAADMYIFSSPSRSKACIGIFKTN